eukprot:TRINITY_DN774_c0_g1_i5.p1 TRINITY_DN774_c0_g1~~TRINITY_DN774_c0_g1_i5.p1  ORF type:complete len:179 (-),score=72.77 TRINITY_DN774_c0_g1_i5:137-673(-)
MAARISASAVDFAAVAAKIPAQQKNAFAALKGKVEGHMRVVNSLPAALPAIDFAAYSKVSVPGMVDTFQAKYAALNIPYPSDQGSLAAIDAQAVEQKAAAAAFCAASAARIAGLKEELAKWEAMQPVEEMNREEALDAGLIGTTISGIVHPDVPSFWPHTETWDEYVARLKTLPADDH